MRERDIEREWRKVREEERYRKRARERGRVLRLYQMPRTHRVSGMFCLEGKNPEKLQVNVRKKAKQSQTPLMGSHTRYTL